MKLLLSRSYFCIKNNTTQLDSFVKSFPFFYKPREIKDMIKIFQQKQENSQKKKQALAFFNLLKSPLASKYKTQNYQQLFNQSLANQQISGQKIYDKYFTTRIGGYVKEIIDNQQSQKVLKAFKILFYLSDCQQVVNSIKKIKQLNSIYMSTQVLIYYIGCLIKNKFDYLEQVQKLYQSLLNDTNYQIPLLLFSIKQFEQYFPHKIIIKCLQIITTNFGEVSAVQLIFMMSNLYQMKKKPSKEIVKFIDFMTKKIIQKQRQDYYNVPLILKIIKLRSHFHMDNNQIAKLLENSPQQYFTIFYQLQGNKEVFLPLITDKSGRFQEQYKLTFNKYIKKEIDFFKQAEQIDLERTVRLFKLILKYYNNLNHGTQTSLCQAIINDIINRFQNTQILYYGLIILFRYRNNQSRSPYQKQLIDYSKKIMTKIMNAQNYSKVLNICYQIFRLNLNNKIYTPNIFSQEIQFEKIDLVPQEINYFFYLIKKVDCSIQQKTKAINGIKQITNKRLSQGSITSIKNIYTIIDSLAFLKYSDDYYVWVNLQKGIQLILKNNKQNIIEKKDLVFINNKMIRNGFGSRKFKQFILKSIDDYSQIKKYIERYIQKAQKHTIRRQRNQEQNKDKKKNVQFKNQKKIQ